MTTAAKKQVLASDVMSKKPITITEQDDLYTAENIMKLAEVRHLPVLRDGILVGLITHRDFLALSISLLADIKEEERIELLRKIPVGKVMKTDIKTIAPDTPLDKACRILIDNKYGCLPVADNGRLLGIITEGDFVKIVYDILHKKS